jgi:hypothetical protein
VTPVPVTVIAEPIVCDLPPLPDPLSKPVGFPSPDGQSILVSISDMALVVGYVSAMRAWIMAATGCIAPGAL